ncbi:MULTISPECIES: strawberry notch C-terminal domain-containing protein [unclassified Coleofasciculus]|uniref:strawberry notch C-terminal domain-containing protein n=1 Tax=unclassified Coleofasciculus TaxID=2692782 RepID=UPI00187EB19E|nr:MULTISPECIES: strawberry notch C-terminal domain-containing protein [unclassified Coleofasciculus]MBE9124778.1 strawberry notch C-terminal domain-containing protein [Coleofasciculus sp. LEGE 07081]MBE9148230.1 strawberry notch C-terminal domain-containing protein [Coleofasciculus sp. LEGE 07092]
MGVTDRQRHHLRTSLTNHFLSGQGFDSISAARTWASQELGQETEFAPGSANAKALEETIEESLVQAGRRLIEAGDDPKTTYRNLVDLYQRQPKLATKSSGSVARQAYSTPLPVAYLASTMAGIDLQGTVYEPAAGNGALLMGANPMKVTTNEIDPDRARALQDQGFNPTIQDATTYKPEQKHDFLIANPPFGSVRDEDNPKPNAKKQWQFGKLKTSQIDHAICLNSLEALKDDGKAVLIIGGLMGDDPVQRSDRYNSLSNRGFFKQLYDNWRVTDHFTVSGELYSRQGAGFPIDMIRLDGRGKSPRPYPAADVPPIYHSFEELEQEVLSRYVSREPELLDANRRAEKEGNADAVLLDGSRGSRFDEVHSHDERVFATAGVESGVVDSPRTPFRRTAPDSRGDAPRDAGWDSGRTTDASQSQPRFFSSSLGEGVGSRQSGNSQSSGAFLDGEIPGASAEGTRADRRSQGINTRNGTSRVVGSDEGNTNRVLKEEKMMDNKNSRDLQVPYQPLSQGKPLNSLVPKNMSVGIRNSLERVEERQGNIDDYVASEMQWSLDELYNKLSAEQIDALALALDNNEQDAETILGDMTGIGKGRVVASMIRKAKLDGMNPIFVTENPNLYRDMLRDLADIGEDINPYYTDSQLNLDTLEGGKINYSAKQHKAAEETILSTGSLGDFDSIFTTYSQMQTVRGQEPDRRQILRKFAPEGMLIMDESHNAGGSGGDLYTRSGIPNRAGFTRELKQSAARTFSSSATYAKRPEVMDLYNRTDMKKAVEDIDSLVGIIQNGGVPMQQALASQLSEAGQYIRRERSYEGVDFDHTIFPTDREMTDSEAQVMQAIMQFDRAKNEKVSQIDEELKKEAKQIQGDSAVGQVGAESINFTSLMHNYLDASNLAKKTQGAIDLAKESLERGEKPILTVSNTMGSFLSQYADENGLQPGERINADFGDMLKRYLERSRDVITKDAFGESNRRRLTDEELGEAGIQAYSEAIDLIEKSDFSKVPISPIDNIRFQLKEAGFKTGEITGRDERVRYERDEQGNLVGFYDLRPASESSRAGKAQAVDQFNNGDSDVLVLNRSGATGISLHSNQRFKDQRRRHMIVVQPERDVNQAVQMFGRVHRTGQVNAPHITIGAGDNPSEKRTMAILMGKLASLNANTTASRSGQIDFEKATDFLNEVGDRVVHELVSNDPELEDKLDYPLKPESEMEGTARRVTGRMAMLTLDEQEALMERIESEYKDTLSREIAMGNNPLEAETLDLDAKTVASIEVQPPDPDSTSPFTGAVIFDVMDVKNNRQPLTTMEAMNVVRSELGLESVSEPEDFDREDVAVAGQENSSLLMEQIDSEACDWKQQRQGLFKTQNAKEKFEDKINQQAQTVKWILETLPVGQTVKLKAPNNSVYYGLVAGHRCESASGENPVSPSSWKTEFLLADSARQISIPHSKIGNRSGQYAVEVQQQDDFEGKDIYSLFDERSGSGRELRGMFRGNLVRAGCMLLGKIQRWHGRCWGKSYLIWKLFP